MKGFAILLLLLIVFAAGLFVGGSLGVTGKPNDVYLQTDYTLGVIPYFHQGDRIHFFDPNLDFVNGQYAPVTDITIPPNHTPCKNLDTNGICIIDVPTGIYKYKCHFCKDPTIPVGTNGPVNGLWGGDPSGGSGGQDSSLPRSTMPGSEAVAAYTLKLADAGSSGFAIPSSRSRSAGQPAALASIYSYDSFYARLARAFVSTFFTAKIKPGKTIVTDKPDKPFTPAANAGTVQAYVDCGADNKISVETPDLWEPETAYPLALGTNITWAKQTGFSSTAPHPFTVQGLSGSNDFASACGKPLAANGVGATLACNLSKTYPSQTVKYTIVDSSPHPTCTAPDGGFSLQVGSSPPAGGGATLPTLR